MINHKSCQIIDLGCIDYKEAYSIQKQYVEKLLQDREQVLFFCEHPSVLTLGRLAKEINILFSREKLKEKRVQIYNIDRGGDVTLHAKGQLVVYPILDLANYGKDLRKYLHELEQVVIALLNGFDIVANRLSGKTGVWIKDKKIASIGIGVRKWISFHGLAINVNTDLNLFSMIKPCGLDIKMTSISEVIGKTVCMDEVKRRFKSCFCKQFKLGTA